MLSFLILRSFADRLFLSWHFRSMSLAHTLPARLNVATQHLLPHFGHSQPEIWAHRSDMHGRGVRQTAAWWRQTMTLLDRSPAAHVDVPSRLQASSSTSR